MDIVFATTNENKMKEIRKIMENTPFNIISLKEAGISIEVVEDGETFEANSIKKAREVYDAAKTIVLADDSGLEIDCLDKQPGVHSSRYMGTDTPYSIKNMKILELLRDVPYGKRSARFVSVISAAMPDGTVLTERAELEGFISDEIKGRNGFGYDPIFYVPGFDKNLAEISIEGKNRISHRGKAMRQMKDSLMKYFNISGV